LALVLAGVIVLGVLSSSLFKEWPKQAMLKAREEYDVLSGDFATAVFSGLASDRQSAMREGYIHHEDTKFSS